MVSECWQKLQLWNMLLAEATESPRAKPAEPLLKRLSDEQRAKVILALVGLVLLGFLLIAMVWLGGRWVRKIAQRPLPGPRRGLDWYDKPLSPPEDPESPEQSE